MQTIDKNNHQFRTSGQSQKEKTVTLIGARGHVGSRIIRLIDKHPSLILQTVSSRQWQGNRLGTLVKGLSAHTAQLSVTCFDADDYQHCQSDILVLALPNGLASEWVNSAKQKDYAGLIVDLSTDFRFDKDWQYGIPELFSVKAKGAPQISNPGCYATAMQLALYPLLDYIHGCATCFGISGYSGAGTTPSDFNNPYRLKDNLLPYKLSGHFHQQEVSHHLKFPIRFIPHVAEFFSGISMTISVPVKADVTTKLVKNLLKAHYKNCPLVKVIDAIPEVAQIRNTAQALIGGIEIDQQTGLLVIICCIDNLMKGAASQAIQNINQYFGWPAETGLIESGQLETTQLK